MGEIEDIGLIERCQEGSREAFDELVLKYQKRVFNLAYRLLNNYEEANDVAQEVFVRAYKGIRWFRKESSIFTWLYRITMNLSKNRLKALNREKKRLEPLDDPIATEEGEIKKEIIANEPSPSEVLVQKERAELIQEALASLDDEFRAALVLRDIEGLTYEEIAQILNLNVGTVKSRLHRARLMLKEKLQGVFR
jgi:RNA polymerase sigma-70 factor (ECF subfamily)